jgi:hypothetical protein
MTLTLKTIGIFSLVGMVVSGAWVTGSTINNGDEKNRAYIESKTEALRVEVKEDLNSLKQGQIEQIKELTEHGVTLKLIEAMIKERLKYGTISNNNDHSGSN